MSRHEARRRLGALLAAAALVMAISLPASAASSNATCSGLFGVLVVHGHHVVADYVFGVGHGNLEWPPAGGGNARGGAALPGGPGPGFHFPNGFAPGASFCTGSNAPGIHIP